MRIYEEISELDMNSITNLGGVCTRFEKFLRPTLWFQFGPSIPVIYSSCLNILCFRHLVRFGLVEFLSETIEKQFCVMNKMRIDLEKILFLRFAILARIRKTSGIHDIK